MWVLISKRQQGQPALKTFNYEMIRNANF